jgi:hypothetical protein
VPRREGELNGWERLVLRADLMGKNSWRKIYD